MKSFIGAVLFICVAFSANAQLLWKVSGNGLNQPSYIIGTHHLAPFSIMDSIAGLKKAMNETQQVYGEMKMSEMQSPATMEKMQKAMMIESDTTLNSLLSPKDFETANKFCKENLMVDLNMAPKLKPAFLLNNVVVMAYIKHVGKFNPQEQLDTFFQSQAIQNGKKVDGNRIVVDEKMQTTVPGLYAAGDCTGGLLQMAKAVYEGAQAGTEAAKALRKG